MLGHQRPRLPGLPEPWTRLAWIVLGGQGSGATGSGEGYQVQPGYFISSLDVSAEEMLATVRAHWSIENSLHWILDATFREDHCRVRKDHAPQNLATLRNISYNLLKRETSLKVGIQGKRLQAGWKEDYLLKVLRS